jgi:serine/threonine protein kinase
LRFWTKKRRFCEIKKGFYENKEIALKIVETDQKSKQLFEQKKIYSLRFISHKNISKYIGYSIINQLFYLLFECSSFGSLKNYLIENFILDEKDFLLILKQISEGLHFLHKDFRNENQFKRSYIAHKDFKSEKYSFF